MICFSWVYLRADTAQTRASRLLSNTFVCRLSQGTRVFSWFIAIGAGANVPSFPRMQSHWHHHHGYCRRRRRCCCCLNGMCDNSERGNRADGARADRTVGPLQGMGVSASANANAFATTTLHGVALRCVALYCGTVAVGVSRVPPSFVGRVRVKRVVGDETCERARGGYLALRCRLGLDGAVDIDVDVVAWQAGSGTSARYVGAKGVTTAARSRVECFRLRSGG